MSLWSLVTNQCTFAKGSEQLLGSMPEHSASRMRDDMGATHSSVGVLAGTRSVGLLSPWTPGDKALRGYGWARLTAQGEALDGGPTPWPQWGR